MANYRIMRQYVGKRSEEVSAQEAWERLSGYYSDIQQAFRDMWTGVCLQTAGGWYWIEKETA
jgi:hypothetical protein